MIAEFKCGFCGKKDYKEIYIFSKKKIVRCTACQLMQTFPQPTKKDLEVIYGKTYFNNKDLCEPLSETIYGYVDYFAERLNKQKGYHSVLTKICSYLETFKITSKNLADIGSGAGYFLDASVDFEFNPIGLEFSHTAASLCKSRYTFPVYIYKESILEFLPKSSQSVITVFDTIEHLQNPFLFLQDAYQVLAPGGLLVITTMDSRSFVSVFLGKRLEDFRRILEHLWFFDRKTLRAAIQDSGFHIIKISSYGHTFDASQLVDRVCAMFPKIKVLKYILRFLLFGKKSVTFNPRTKMIIFAKRI
jgi:2-polyprenyl-3-methyl-5-hydroxy-6-metoxy-1,4-benzoquinol methylase